MLIRNASTEDINQVLDIEELCYETPWPQEAFEEEIGNEDIGFGMVAEEDGLVVGFVTGLRVTSAFHLHNIAVHPDYQGHGIGTALLQAVEAYCRRNNFRQILLEVRKDNEVARHIYLEMDFKAVGTRHDYYGPGRDAFLYTKELVVD